MSYNATGGKQFQEFADDIEAVSDRVPEIIEDAIEITGQEFINIVTDKIKASTSQRGSTLNSSTSRYSPGGTNDSSDDNLHIDSHDAWFVYTGSRNEGFVSIRSEAQDRAWWLEKGTRSHAPSDDKPMYFYIGGDLVVVLQKSEKIKRLEEKGHGPMKSTLDKGTTLSPEQRSAALEGDTPAYLFESGIPGKVEGVEAVGFFEYAADQIRKKERFSKNLRDQFKRVLEEEVGT